MNPMVAIWATSLVGAALFLAAGFLWGRARAGSAGAARVAPGPSVAEGALMRKVTQMEVRLAEAHAERDEVIGQRNEALRARDEAVTQLRASPVQASGGSLQYQVISLETEVRQLREEKVLHNTKAVALEHELDQSRRASKKEGGGVKKLVSEQAALERRRKELELTRASLDRYKVENQKLQANLRTLEAEKVRIEMRLEDVQQEEEEQGRATQPFSTVSTVPLADLPDTDLQALVDKVACGVDVRVVVLGDSLGLKVVGRGAETDELAAAAALLADVARRAVRLLPVEEIVRLELLTGEAMVATVCPFSTTRGDLVLAALGSGSGPDQDLLEKVKERVGRLV